MRICNKCNENKKNDAYYVSIPNSCKICVVVQQTAYNKTDRGKKSISDSSRNNYANLRNDVIDKYGGKCVCCGEQERTFLCIDHINGDGAVQRKAGIKGKAMLLWIRANNYPNTLRILCYNCNNATRYNRVCPHTTTTNFTT